MKQQITFKMTDDEHKEIVEKAKSKSLPVATFCRYSILNSIREKNEK